MVGYRLGQFLGFSFKLDAIEHHSYRIRYRYGPPDGTQVRGGLPFDGTGTVELYNRGRG
jgi:hypothetical protein